MPISSSPSLSGLLLACSLLTACGDSGYWVLQLGEGSAHLDPPIELSNGDFIVSGSIPSAGSGEQGDAYLGRLSPAGEVLATAPLRASWVHVAATPQDDLVFRGDFEDPATGEPVVTIGLMDETAAIEWSRPMPGVSGVGSLGEGEIWAAGYLDGANEDGFFILLDSAGKEKWAHHKTDKKFNRVFAAARAPDDGVVIAGLTGDEFLYWDGFVTALDGTGQVLWSRTIPQTRIHDIAIDPEDGTIYCAATSNEDVAAGALDAAGNDLFWNVWSTEPDGQLEEFDFATSISLGPDGTLLLAGYFNSDIDFGLDKPLAGPANGFLLELTTEGAPLWQMRAGGEASSDILTARWSSDGSILAALRMDSIGYAAEAPVQLGRHSITIRGNSDTAVMRIGRDAN